MKTTDPYLIEKQRLEDFRKELSIKQSDLNKTNLLQDINLVDQISADLGTLEETNY